MFSLLSYFLGLVLLSSLLFKEYYSSCCFLQRKSKLLKEITYHISLEEWEQAEKKVLVLLTKKSYRSLVLLSYVRILKATHRLEKALEIIEEVLHSQSKEKSLFYLEKAHCLEMLGQYDKALPLFYKTIPLFLDMKDYIAFARSLLVLSRPHEAKEVLSSVKDNLIFFDQKLLMGDIYFILKDYENALFWFRGALELSKKFSIELCKKIGHSYRKLKLYAKAQAFFLNLIKYDPNNFEALFALGLCEEEQENYKQALLFYQKSYLWEKKDPILMKHGGDCAFFSKNYLLAKECFEQLLKQVKISNNVYVWIKYACCLEALAEWKRAEKVYTFIIKKFPNCAEGYKGLSWMYGVGLTSYVSWQLGLFYARRSIELQEDQVSLEILSACEARAGNFKEAYRIQSLLMMYDLSKEEQKRRQQLLRILRQNLPLGNKFLSRSHVYLAA